MDGYRGIRIVGSGEHHLTKIFDAQTGEDIGVRYGITAVRYEVGGGRDHVKPVLVLEAVGPVEIEIGPSAIGGAHASRR